MYLQTKEEIDELEFRPDGGGWVGKVTKPRHDHTIVSEDTINWRTAYMSVNKEFSHQIFPRFSSFNSCPIFWKLCQNFK